MGTMGSQSTESIDGLDFLAKMPAAFDSAGANRPPSVAPSAATKERRLQSNFKFITLPSQHSRAIMSQPALGGLRTAALPTISISESPGIHSSAMHARDGALPGEKYVPYILFNASYCALCASNRALPVGIAIPSARGRQRKT